MSDEAAAAEPESEEVAAPWWGGEADSGLGSDMTGDPSPGAGASMRYWMPKGSERKIIFLTDGDGPNGPPPPIFEHNIKLGGSWRNWFTCLEPLGIPCPLCQYANENDGFGRRYKAMYFTIIDTHEFEGRDGKKKKNQKRLFVAKKDTVEILRRRFHDLAEMGKSLRGAIFKVYRTNSDKSAAVGEDFTYIGHADLDAFPDTTQFDYAEILKPDPEKVKKVITSLGGAVGGGGPKEGTSAGVDYS